MQYDTFLNVQVMKIEQTQKSQYNQTNLRTK